MTTPIRAYVFIFCWNLFIIAGTAYIVFWLGHSGWWFALALILLMSFGNDDKKEDDNDDLH